MAADCGGAVELPDDDPCTSLLPMEQLNPFLTCHICFGYFIDATTLIECLHSFCRSCIVQYIENGNIICPTCGTEISESDPYSKLRPDAQLQDITFKLLPSLKEDEKRRRKQFELTPHPPKTQSQTQIIQANEGAKRRKKMKRLHGQLSFTELEREKRQRNRELASIADEYLTVKMCCNETLVPKSKSENENNGQPSEIVDNETVTWLRCPAQMTVGHMKKFAALKLSPPDNSFQFQPHDIVLSTSEHFSPTCSEMLLDAATLNRLYQDQICSRLDDTVLCLYWRVKKTTKSS